MGELLHRITVGLILRLLVAGMSPKEIAEDYGISVEDVKAALLYTTIGWRGC